MRYEDLKKGDYVYCIKDLVMNNGRIVAFKGKTYEISNGPGNNNGWSHLINNDKSDHMVDKDFFYEYFMVDDPKLTDQILGLLDMK